MRRRVALPILPGTRFPAPFGGLAVECRDEPTATFSGPPYGLRLLCLLGNGTNLLKWKARAAPQGLSDLSVRNVRLGRLVCHARTLNRG